MRAWIKCVDVFMYSSMRLVTTRVNNNCNRSWNDHWSRMLHEPIVTLESDLRGENEARKKECKKSPSLLKQLLPFIRNEQNGWRIFRRRLIPRTSETSFLFSRKPSRGGERGGCGGVDNVEKKKKEPKFDHDEGSMNKKNELLSRSFY